MENIKTLSIVIPAYNEGPTIHRILDRIRNVSLINGIEKELIIVNDCSKDNTEESILRYKDEHPTLNIQYHKHAVNQGKGAALHTGPPHYLLWFTRSRARSPGPEPALA